MKPSLRPPLRGLMPSLPVTLLLWLGGVGVRLAAEPLPHRAAAVARPTSDVVVETEADAIAPPATESPTESATASAPDDPSAPPTPTPPTTPAKLPDETPTDNATDAAAPTPPVAQETAWQDVGVLPPRTPTAELRWQLLAQADQLLVAGQTDAAVALYRQAKEPFAATGDRPVRPDPITDPAQLPGPGQVYWREAQAGLELQLESRIFVPLQLLVAQYPEFIPGHVTLARALVEKADPEAALAVLNQAVSRYPAQATLARSRIELLAQTEQFIEAAIAARQFAILYADHPAAPEFHTLADTHLERYQAKVRSRLTGNVIGSLLTGALGFAVTGNPFGPISALQSTILLLRGESAVGDRLSQQAQRQLPMVEDEEVTAYVNRLGQRLANVAGRDDFDYEFHVVLHEDLNAFALPGGKIFVFAGAIAKTESEAELAGLLAHELAHAILSHGFQLVTRGNLTANIFQFVPLGGLATNLLVLNYSREMEQQADIVGTRLLAASGYAADGLRNLMLTLSQEPNPGPTFALLSTHPITRDRVRYLETLITEGGYNRYAFEGVEEHDYIRRKVADLLEAEIQQRGARETRP